MGKLSKILSGIGAAALVASVVPYYFKQDKEAGTFEMGGLLWNLKKTPGEEKANYTLEVLPMLKGKEADEEEPVAEEVIDEIVDAAKEAGEEAKDIAEDAKEAVEEVIETVKDKIEE